MKLQKQIRLIELEKNIDVMLKSYGKLEDLGFISNSTNKQDCHVVDMMYRHLNRGKPLHQLHGFNKYNIQAYYHIKAKYHIIFIEYDSTGFVFLNQYYSLISINSINKDIPLSIIEIVFTNDFISIDILFETIKTNLRHVLLKQQEFLNKEINNEIDLINTVDL